MSETKEFNLHIEAGKTEKQYIKDLWLYRELFFFLSWRDILVRYKQTVIGILWAIIRPFLTMIVFTFIFGNIAKLPSEGGAPYTILVYAAMLPWQFFASALQESSNSLITNANMISKIYFPRIIVPTSAVIVSFVDFLISSGILVILMLYYRYTPPISVFMLPLFILTAFFLSVGCGLWLSALNVKYRDFRYIVPFIVQFGLYVSPVGFSSNVIPSHWRLLYSVNPMVGVIDGVRWAVIGSTDIFIPSIFLSLLITTIILITGLIYFRRTEKTFADII